MMGHRSNLGSLWAGTVSCLARNLLPVQRDYPCSYCGGRGHQTRLVWPPLVVGAGIITLMTVIGIAVMLLGRWLG
jgi:hypothetical protein